MSRSLARKKGLSQFRSYSDIIVLTRACDLICLGLSAGRGKGLSAGRGKGIQRFVYQVTNDRTNTAPLRKQLIRITPGWCE